MRTVTKRTSCEKRRRLYDGIFRMGLSSPPLRDQARAARSTLPTVEPQRLAKILEVTLMRPIHGNL